MDQSHIPSDILEDVPRIEGSPSPLRNCDGELLGPTGEWPMKSTFNNDDFDFLDLSFEEQDNEHPSAIEKAYLEHLRPSIENRQVIRDGLNDQNIQYFQQRRQSEDKGVNELIASNSLILEKDKTQFIFDLKTENVLRQTIKGLTLFFPPDALQEIIFLIHLIWKHYFRFQDQYVIKNPIIASFHRQLDLNNIVEHCQKIPKLTIPENTLIKQADLISKRLAAPLLRNQTIKLLTMTRDSNKTISVEKETCFGRFLKVLCRAVFLSAEGILFHPSQSFEVSLNPKRSKSSRSILSSEEDSEDEDREQEETGSNSRKKRKLQ